METITINGEEYVKKSEITGFEPVIKDNMPYCMVRTCSAGVFAGYIKERNGKEATLLNARRIWYWEGAASLSQLAVDGTSKPEECKFPCAVPEVILTEVIEIIPISEKAKKSIDGVEVWEA